MTAHALRAAEIDALEAARADLYALFSATLGAAPSADLLGRIAGLTGDDTPLGSALGRLGAAAASADAEAVSRDHFDLFIGVGRGELLPYASYYLTGFLNERPLAAVRADLAAVGIARAEGLHDPEDHIAILCGAMADMAARGWRGHASAPSQALFFQRHLAPWAGRFFADLSRVRACGFYPALGVAGAAFMAVEADAFALGDD
ncbi:MAG: molecular chaperone [Rubrimonas sp.]